MGSRLSRDVKMEGGFLAGVVVCEGFIDNARNTSRRGWVGWPGPRERAHSPNRRAAATVGLFISGIYRKALDDDIAVAGYEQHAMLWQSGVQLSTEHHHQST